MTPDVRGGEGKERKEGERELLPVNTEQTTAAADAASPAACTVCLPRPRSAALAGRPHAQKTAMQPAEYLYLGAVLVEEKGEEYNCN